jgi:hypothetical protein
MVTGTLSAVTLFKTLSDIQSTPSGTLAAAKTTSARTTGAPLSHSNLAQTTASHQFIQNTTILHLSILPSTYRLTQSTHPCHSHINRKLLMVISPKAHTVVSLELPTVVNPKVLMVASPKVYMVASRKPPMAANRGSPLHHPSATLWSQSASTAMNSQRNAMQVQPYMHPLRDNELTFHLQTCNFMFKCGEKKQCNYYGFRETMTMCHERGEECSWPFFDENGDEYDVPENEHEHPYGGKPQQPHGNGGKPEQPHGGKPENPYGKPEQPHNNGGKPDSPYGKPEQPLGGKPETPYGPVGPEHPQEEQPHGPNSGEQPYGPKGGEQPHGHNGTQHPHSPYGSPYGPNGQKITKDKTA